MKTVYLAGPITGLTYDEGQDWRSEAAQWLSTLPDVRPLSPLRGKGYLRGMGKLLDQYHGVHPLSEEKGIVTRDRNDCMRSDVVLANFLGAERVSIGTVLEVAWADAARVPLVAVMEQDNIHSHGMLRQLAGYVTEDLDDALVIVATVLGFDVVPTARLKKAEEPVPEAEQDQFPREDAEGEAITWVG